MKRFLLIIFILFSCFSAHARHVESALSAEKTHIDDFFENTPDLHPVDQLYLLELHIAYNEFSAQDAHRPLNLWYFRARYFSDEMGRFISRDPLGYVDGMSLYNGYFAERFWLDPSGKVTPTADNLSNGGLRFRENQNVIPSSNPRRSTIPPSRPVGPVSPVEPITPISPTNEPQTADDEIARWNLFKEAEMKEFNCANAAFFDFTPGYKYNSINSVLQELKKRGAKSISCSWKCPKGQRRIVFWLWTYTLNGKDLKEAGSNYHMIGGCYDTVCNLSNYDDTTAEKTTEKEQDVILNKPLQNGIRRKINKSCFCIN